MSYFLGAISTIIIILFFVKTKPNYYSNAMPQIRYSQSHIFKVIKPFIQNTIVVRRPRNSQSQKHYQKYNMRVIFIENHAYWIKDNVFYVADFENGVVNDETTRVVDTIGMDSVELDKMLFIMDKLREGFDNDSGSTGNK